MGEGELVMVGLFRGAARTLAPPGEARLLAGDARLLEGGPDAIRALVLAAGAGLTPDAALMAVAIGTFCTFLSPIGHQSNTLVVEPGGYRFAEYARLGAPLAAICLALGTWLVVLVWQ
jgi:hypothetical protein